MLQRNHKIRKKMKKKIYSITFKFNYVHQWTRLVKRQSLSTETCNFGTLDINKIRNKYFNFTYAPTMSIVFSVFAKSRLSLHAG